MKPEEWAEEIETAKMLLGWDDHDSDEAVQNKGDHGSLKSALDRVRTIYPK
jgi:hypothetical protein